MTLFLTISKKMYNYFIKSSGFMNEPYSTSYKTIEEVIKIEKESKETRVRFKNKSFRETITKEWDS